ncbi:MAG: Lrp/AsnC family transcriptional regulator, partial [Ruthenibacterium sp.]
MVTIYCKEESCKMEQILRILEENARISIEELAVMTQKTPAEVAALIDDAQKAHILNGYRALVDWEKADVAHV